MIGFQYKYLNKSIFMSLIMINIAVIGVGAMGFHHTRVLSELDSVNLRAICDSNSDSAKNVAHKFHIPKFYTDYKEMIEAEELEAVVIAVPTAFHKDVAVHCLRKNLNTFVEKPIADTLEAAQEIIDAAKQTGKLLMVGHVERFNPAVTKIKELIDSGELGDLYLVNTVRAGPSPKRLLGKREGVLVDLAVHDADIINYLVGDIKQVFSQLIVSGKQEIYAKALFKMDKGLIGSSEFSWVSPRKRREIEIYGVKGILRGNYVEQTVWFYENGEDLQNFDPKNYYKAVLLGGAIREGKVIKYPVQKQEPLKLEHAHFVSCIKNKSEPLITPEYAKKALAIALSILESGNSDSPVKINGD